MRRFGIVALVAIGLLVGVADVSAQGPAPPVGATVVPRGGLRPPGGVDQTTAQTTAQPTAQPTAQSTVQQTAPPSSPSTEPNQDQPPQTGTAGPSTTATVGIWPTTPVSVQPTIPVTAPPSDGDRPILRVKKTNVDPSPVSPGGEVRLRIEVENVGRRDAERVQLSLSSSVFHAIGSGAVLFKEEIDAGETRPFEARMRADSAALSGVYAVGIGLRWDDAAGGSYSDQSSIGIEVVSHTAARPAVVVTSSQVPSRCVPGVPFSVVFTLTNNGGQEARNIVLVPVAGPVALAGGESPPVNLSPGGSASVSLRMVAAETAEPGANSQTLEIRYDDPDGQRYTDTTVFGISVTSDRILLPQPMVTRYSVGVHGKETDTLHPGQVFDLRLEIKNVGSRDAVNTRMALGGGASSAQIGSGTGAAQLGVFAPLETSNVRFLDRMSAGASQVVRQSMVVDGGAKPGVYTLEVQFSFTDVDGEDMSTSEVISLLVSRRVNLEVNPVVVITSTMVGQEVPFSVEIVNAGDASVNVGNTEAVADGGFDVIDGTLFIGPIDAGSVYPFDATLLAVEEGEAEVTVVVHYTDDFGQSSTYERSFAMLVEEAPEIVPGLVAAEEQSEGNIVLRFIRGLLGLGASPPRPPAETQPGDSMTIEMVPADAVQVDVAQPIERQP